MRCIFVISCSFIPEKKYIVQTTTKDMCHIWRQKKNVPKKPKRATQKDSLHPTKVTLCIWWDWEKKNIVYYELRQNQTLNWDKYCSQLSRSKAVESLKSARNWLIGSLSSSTRTTPDLTSICRADRNWHTLVGMSYYPRPNHLTSLLPITTDFDHYKSLLMERS